MKKFILVLLCFLLLALSGCSAKYKRINFEKDTLGESQKKYISENTNVINTINKTFPEKIPIYEISERKITEEDLQQMMKQLEIPDNAPGQSIILRGNRLTGFLGNLIDFSRPYYSLTDAQLEAAAWEVFEKLPFMEGEYKYLGIRATHTRTDSTGKHLVRVGVLFQRILDGVRVIGNDHCYLYFDNSGLVEFDIELYSYKKIGEMDVIPFQDASPRLTNPDSLYIRDPGEKLGIIDTLQVDGVKFLLVNQHSRGCQILQPIYYYVGTVTDDQGVQSKFKSLVIAIPESYTHD